MDTKSMIPWGRDRTTTPVAHNGESWPFATLRGQIDRLFDDFWRDFHMPMGRQNWGDAWPNVDVAETDSDVTVTAELPGMSEKDVEVTLTDGMLTLKGEKKTAKKDAIRSEIFYGTFERTLSLGEVDADTVHSDFTNGVLTLIFRKKREAQSRVKRIDISKAH